MSIEEWCGYLSELTGLPCRFEPTEHTIDSVDIDLGRMHALVGPTTVGWRDGHAPDGGGPTPGAPGRPVVAGGPGGVGEAPALLVPVVIGVLVSWPASKN